MIPRQYFDKKIEAKKMRDSLNNSRKNEKGFVGFKVTFGPDHRHFTN